MNRKLLVAVVSGALALPLAASVQADATVYGSLRFGVELKDDDRPDSAKDSDSMWNLGSNRSSRWGVKGSMEAGEGVTAGFKFERAVGFNTITGKVGDDKTVTGSSSGARHHHVYLSGDFGTLTFGQQDAPYFGATTWDGTQTLGGITDFIYRASGVSYASNLGGPFNFAILSGSGEGGKEQSEDGANHLEVSANLAAGPVNFNAGYYNDDDAEQRIGGTVGGSLAAITWEVGYDSGTDSCNDTDASRTDCDDERYGMHVGYMIGDGNAYIQFSEKDSDHNMNDTDAWTFGYWHALAPGVVVYAEHQMRDSMHKDHGELSGTTTVAAVKVDF